MRPEDRESCVGPVLVTDAVGEAVLAALRRRNDLALESRGAYVRACAPRRCVLRRADVEEILGRAFEMPRELERVMPSFAGRLAFTDEGAEWTCGTAAAEPAS